MKTPNHTLIRAERRSGEFSSDWCEIRPAKRTERPDTVKHTQTQNSTLGKQNQTDQRLFHAPYQRCENHRHDVRQARNHRHQCGISRHESITGGVHADGSGNQESVMGVAGIFVEADRVDGILHHVTRLQGGGGAETAEAHH